MNLFKADLHCHSTCSDGSLSPHELILLAKEKGLSALSITDHDSIGAYSADLFSFAEEQDIRLLVGVELSSESLNTGVHVLGYGVDISHQPFLSFLESVHQKRIDRVKKIIEKLQEHNIDIDYEKMVGFVKTLSSSTNNSIGRAHLAKYLVKFGYVDSMEKAFEEYLKDEACCYVAGEKYSTREVIEKIHQADGKAVLAHPHLIKKRRFALQLLDLPFDGLEGFYAKISHDRERYWIQKAKERNWICTGGSDFHGASKLHITLGSSWTNEETFRRLYNQ